MTTVHKDILIIERTIEASSDIVFDAFASIEALKQWFGPGSCYVKAGKMNFTVGGTYELTMVIEEGKEVELIGTFEEINRPDKLVYTWKWVGGEAHKDFPNSKVTITFDENEGATQLKLMHEGLPSDESREHHNFGWNGCFDKLNPFCSAAS